jgi:hypothetical protein
MRKKDSEKHIRRHAREGGIDDERVRFLPFITDP